jgi:hypothetical protein
MKKKLIRIAKWSGITLGSIFLLISGGLYLFKDEICGAVINEVNKHLKAKVSVSEVDLTFWASFPNLSVDFNHVFIQDSYAQSTLKDTLLYSERIRLKFNPMDIWNEEYRVKKVQVYPGCVNLKVNKVGEVNYDIFKPSEDTSSSAFKFELEKVLLEDLRFSYANRATAQTYKSSINEMELSGNFSDEQFDLKANCELKVEKVRSGEITLLSNRPAHFDMNLHVNQKSGSVSIPNALIYISNLPFALSGSLTPDKIDFNIKSKDIQLADLASNFSVDEVDEIKKFDGKGKVYFDLDIDGETKSTSPAIIECAFGVQNGELTEPVNRLRIRNIFLDGKYSNRGGNEKEFLKLAAVRFTTAGGPFAGNLMLTRFQAPRFQGNAHGNINLNVFHSLFRIPHIETIKGNISLHTDFDVKAEPRSDETLDYHVVKCEGDMDLRSVSTKLIDDKRKFRNVNGRLYLRNDEAGIERLKVELGSSDLQIDGVFQNIVSFLKKDGKIKANIQLKSKLVDISDLGNSTKEEKIQDGRQFVLPDYIEGRVFMEVGRMVYEGHTFKQLSGNMLFGNRIFHFPSIALNSAGADIKGNLTIDERSPEIFYITTNISSTNIQFKPLFREWNNFRQEVISENNVSGKAQAKVYFEAPFDLRSGVLSKSIKSEIYLRILDGRLKDVEAFKSITESLKTSSSAKLAVGAKNIALLDKKLQDLKFETLENTLIIRNGRMEIPQMKINSSALDIETSGTHTFDNVIDYRFAFRFRELKEKNQVSEFGEEQDDETGMRVYMRMYGNLSDPKIEWDKQSKKADAKENREAEKEDVKSILKTEFGFFKNDTSVKIYQEKKKPREKIEFEFGDANKDTDRLDVNKPEKDSKLKSKLKNLKEQSEKEKQQNVDIEFE